MLRNFLLFLLEDDSIFKRVYHENTVIVSANGNSQQYINGSIQMTKPEFIIDQMDKKYDWCSKCSNIKEEKAWITFAIRNKKINLRGYYLKAACCYLRCSCELSVIGTRCPLYSWSLQVSSDNITFSTVHHVEKDENMLSCAERTYDFHKSYLTKFVRLIQTDVYPGEPSTIGLNKIELFGDLIDDPDFEKGINFLSDYNDDDDVSIIGHISKKRNITVY